MIFLQLHGVDEPVEVTGGGAGLLEVDPPVLPALEELLEEEEAEYTTTGGAFVGTVPPAIFTTRRVGPCVGVGTPVGIGVEVCSFTGMTT
jgi:hypothetical protein